MRARGRWRARGFFSFSKENLRTLALSILGAVIFWVFNALNKEYSTRIDYPISFRYQESGLVAVDPLPDDISLECSGRGWVLFRKYFGINVVPVTIPLEQPVETKKIPLSQLAGVISDQIRDLQVVTIYTDSLRINIQEVIELKLPLVLDTTTIVMEEGFLRYSPVILSADSVLFRGPSSILETLESPFIIDFPLAKIDKDVNQSVTIPDIHPLVEAIPENVTASFSTSRIIASSFDLPVKYSSFPRRAPQPVDSLVRLTVSYPEKAETPPLAEDFSVIGDYKNSIGDSLLVLEIAHNYPEVLNLTLSADTLKLPDE